MPGRTVNRMAGMFRGEGKTDAKDARHRQPAPAAPLQPPPAPRLLHGRLLQHQSQRPPRTFYQRKRSERLTHTQALPALARHLADVLWALLRDGRHFTAAPHHQRSRLLDKIIQIRPAGAAS